MFQNRFLTIVISLLGLVVIVALIGWGYFFVSRLLTPQYSAERTVFSVLLEENAAFSEANQLIRARDAQAARAKYVEALSFAQDPFQAAYIQYWIGIADEALGDYVMAIRGFKEVADYPVQFPLLRAYAVLKIGLLHGLYGFGPNRDIIVEETFKGEPYASFFVEGDVELSYKRLHEYASSLYPVAISELQIANWHANQLLSLQELSTSTAEYLPHTIAILEKLESAEADIARSLEDPNASRFMPTAFTLLGEVRAKFVLASVRGNPYYEDAEQSSTITFETAEDAYLQALNQRALLGEHDGNERFYYASFMERYLLGREEDIRAVLSSLYRIPLDPNVPVVKFLRQQRGADTWMSESLVRLAKIDPEFKQLLVSLEWSEADFL